MSSSKRLQIVINHDWHLLAHQRLRPFPPTLLPPGSLICKLEGFSGIVASFAGCRTVLHLGRLPACLGTNLGLCRRNSSLQRVPRNTALLLGQWPTRCSSGCLDSGTSTPSSPALARAPRPPTSEFVLPGGLQKSPFHPLHPLSSWDVSFSGSCTQDETFASAPGFLPLRFPQEFTSLAICSGRQCKSNLASSMTKKKTKARIQRGLKRFICVHLG